MAIPLFVVTETLEAAGYGDALDHDRALP
jgi:hypothetical protein